MRLSAATALFLAMLAPATAADSIADQAQRAYDLYAGGLSQKDFLSARYGQDVLRNIDGNWVRLDGPDPVSGIETYGADTEKHCAGTAAVTLAAPNQMSMTLATNLKGSNFTQTYTLIAGATFGEHTDAADYLAAIGLGPDKVGPNFDQQRALALSLANGLVQIYRPSADILVLTRDRGYPIVLARCPTP